MSTDTALSTTSGITRGNADEARDADAQAICEALVAAYDPTGSLGWQAGTDAMAAAGRSRAIALAVQAAVRDHFNAAARAMVEAIPLVAAPDFREYAGSEADLDFARDHLVATAMAVAAADAILATTPAGEGPEPADTQPSEGTHGGAPTS